MGAETIFSIGAVSIVALVIAAVSALKGWQGWLELRKMEVANQLHHGADYPAPATGGRIELADLKERVRKLEAIASGIEY
ncbi:hypothetical protein ACFQPG_11905 [Sphingomonas sp. GCM10030256]|uniref:hypothetical protein n=1 Tax=Sphingomonas sp. GCM10030256 TaxID=3273427 RepID=UPI0036139465